MMQILKAIFMGENGELGYTKGRMYTLALVDHQIEGALPQVGIYAAENPEGMCKYRSVEEFFKNWKIV